MAPLLFNLAFEVIPSRLRINLKGTTEYKSTQVLAYVDDTAIISWSLPDATEIYKKLAIAAREIGLEINTDKTKLLIQTEKLEKRISRQQVGMHHLKDAKAKLWAVAQQEKMIGPGKQLTVMLT
jgi:hypothetical protein